MIIIRYLHSPAVIDMSRIPNIPSLPDRLFLALALSAAACQIQAADAPSTPRLIIHEHRFEPVEIHVRAGQALVLQVENRDGGVEEFESYDLDREQRVRPGEVGMVRLGPLAPGRYPFFGDFHRNTAQGVLVAD
jgi:hypothetical protein